LEDILQKAKVMSQAEARATEKSQAKARATENRKLKRALQKIAS
jgi:hypothetical protein